VLGNKKSKEKPSRLPIKESRARNMAALCPITPLNIKKLKT